MSTIKGKLLICKEPSLLNKEDASIFKSQASFDQPQNIIKNTSEMKELIQMLKEFVSVNKKQNQKQNTVLQYFQYNDMEPRDRPITVPMPIQQSQITKQSLQKYITTICTVVWSKGFYYYSTNQLSFQNTKIYCSQQILQNITKLSQKYNLKAQDFSFINQHIQNNILDYMLNKYPMTLCQEVNKNLNNSIRQIDNTDNIANNFLYRSEVVFKYRQNAQYNDLIMKTINEAIRKIQSKYDNKTVYEKFQDKMMLLFESITDYEWMNNLQDTADLNQSHNRMPSISSTGNLHKKHTLEEKTFQSQYIKIRQKEKSSYEEKVRQKLPDSTRHFTEEEINSHRLKIQNPQILRILTKWCEELQRKFDSTDYFEHFVSRFSLEKSTFLSMMRGEIKSNLLVLINEQKKNIKDQLQQLAKNNYYMQSELLMRKLMSPQSNEIQRYERISALFSIDIVNNLHSYIITYLNRLIHGLLSVIRKFSQLPTSQQLEFPSNQSIVTFQVMDLVRCKCSSKQKQILKIYHQIIKFCEENDNMELVRVVNRLKKGTNDILINVKYRNVLCEIQLAITNKNNTFLEYSNAFNHYLYQLKRSFFGPLTQLCGIWKNLDNRYNVYSNLYPSQRQKKDFGFHDCNKKGAGFMTYNKPFLCNICSKHYYHNKFIKKHIKCKTCDFWMCAYCQLQRSSCTELLGAAFNSDTLTKKCKKVTGSLKNIPNYGMCIYIQSQQVIIQPFRKYQNKQYTKIVGINNKNIYQIYDITTEKQAEKFMSKFLIYQLEQEYGRTHIKINDDLVTQYLRTQKYKHALSKNKDSINLNSQNICNADLQALFSIGKQHEKDRIKCLQLIGNNLTSCQVIAHSFHNLTKLELSKNSIKNFAKLKNFQRLQKINLNSNGIKQFPQEICEIKSLKEICLNENTIKTLPISLKQCYQLTSIHISSNKLSQIPQFVFELRNLTNLDMNSNFIKDIPASISAARKLKSFSLQNNYIKHIPEEIQNLVELQRLNLSHNKIEIIPSLCLLSLKHLNLRHNSVQNIDGFLKTTLNIKEIDLSYNKISSLEKIDSFNNLKFLNISHNEITVFPTFGKQCSTLKHLLMSNNKLSKMGSVQTLIQLQQIQLSDNYIQEIHHSLFKLNNLYILHMQNNRLKKINNIQMQSLIKLFMKRNKIIQFKGIHMKNLQEVDLSQNQLNAFQFNFLPKLKKINLNINQLEKLQLNSYHRVSIVNATRNKLKNMPTFHENNQIKLLNLQHNSIQEIPHSMSSSTYLRSLNLSNNRIKIIPHALQHLNLNEKSLYLENNPIEIVQCFNYIMAKCGKNFIKELQKKNKEKVDESKCDALQQSQTHLLNFK